MKRSVPMGMFIVALALPAYAGHGTIQETETAIIIEYSGDADDAKSPNASNQHQPQSAAPQAAPVAAPEAEPSEDRSAKAQNESSRRQERAAARRAGRQSRSGGQED